METKKDNQNKKELNEQVTESSFINQILMIAIPITIQQIVTSSGIVVDNLMVGRLGSTTIGAVGAINKFISLFWFSIFGLTSGGASFTNQFLAVKDYRGVRKVLGITLILNFIVALIFTYTAVFRAEETARLFTDDFESIQIAKRYFYGLAPYFIFSAIPYAFSYPLRSMGKAYLTLYVMLISQVVNIVFDYFLIMGNMGFPQLGVVGAALATVLSKIVETIIILLFVYRVDNFVRSKVHEIFSFDLKLFLRYFKVVVPLAFNEISYAFGLLVYQIYIGGMSPVVLAAYGMIGPFENLLLTMFSGLSSSALILIGKALGKEDYDKAYTMGEKFRFLVPLVTLAIGILIFLFARNLISLYGIKNITENSSALESVVVATRFLKILGLFLVVRIFNFLHFGGILKSGGDTLFLLFIGTGMLWLVGVPLVIVTSQLNLPPYIVYGMVYLEEIIVAIIINFRFKSKLWMNTLIKF